VLRWGLEISRSVVVSDSHTGGQMQLLTHLSTTHCLALFSVQCPTTRLRVEELNEAVSLLYGYLSEHAVSVEAVEDVALCDFFSGKIAFEHGLEAHGWQQGGSSNMVGLPMKRREPMGN
jgi:hypothetical protein